MGLRSTDNLGNQGHTMTKTAFREMLKKVDSNGDGQISRKELREALRELGLNYNWFRMWWNAWGAMSHVDLNRNKHVDGDREIELLIDYAQKKWGINITN
ncbi:hypothetical protein J5N97_016930 [Dioscorea zingiberensis]|uniref:EF-hand domain-containing protein n=1 Tax=Dioscorea zingiberensis TaxID=325984 RepID=A0A9D5CMW3_9LILI|nr:hypothetical protein J5N97_016930 [Dioscorea zingiberensis]